MPRRKRSLLILLLIFTSSCYSTRSYTYLRAESALLPPDSKVTNVLTTSGQWVPFDRLGGTITHQRNGPNALVGDVTGINGDGSILRIPIDSIVALKVSQEAVNTHSTAAVVISSLAAMFLVLVVLAAAAWSGSVG